MKGIDGADGVGEAVTTEAGKTRNNAGEADQTVATARPSRSSRASRRVMEANMAILFEPWLAVLSHYSTC